MIYLTTDNMDHGVYLDLRKQEPRRRPGGTEHFFQGLLGNGVAEVQVTVKSWRDCLDVVFSRGDLFRFVEESTIRTILAKVVRELTTKR